MAEKQDKNRELLAWAFQNTKTQEENEEYYKQVTSRYTDLVQLMVKVYKDTRVFNNYAVSLVDALDKDYIKNAFHFPKEIHEYPTNFNFAIFPILENNITKRFYDYNKQYINEEQIHCLENMMQSKQGLFKIVHIRKDASVCLLEEVVTKEKIEVFDDSMWQTFVDGNANYFIGSVLDHDGFHLSGCLYSIQIDDEFCVKDYLKNPKLFLSIYYATWIKFSLQHPSLVEGGKE